MYAILRHMGFLLPVIPLMMVLSTSLIVSDELMHGVISGKYFWFYAWIGPACLATALLFLMKRHPIGISAIDLCVCAFWVAGILSHLLTSQQINTKFVLFLLLGVLYVLFRITLNQHAGIQYVFAISILTLGLIEAIWGLRQLYGFLPSNHHLYKTTGSFFNPGPYAGYLAIIAPLAFYYLVKHFKVLNHRLDRRSILFYIRWSLALGTFVAIVVILPATASRASWLALVGGCSIVGVILFLQRRKIRRQLIGRTKLVISVAAGFFIVSVAGLFGVYHLKKESADGRALIWKISAHAIADNPMGAGFGRFSGIYGLYQTEYFKSGQPSEQEIRVAESPDYAFNEYLQIGVELGVFPSLLFISVIGISAVRLYRNREIAVLGMLLSFMIFALVSYPLNVLPFPILLVYMLAVGADGDPPKADPLFIPSLLAFSFALITLLILNRLPTYHAYQTWRNLGRVHAVDIKGVTADYEELLPALDDNKHFLFELVQSIASNGRYEESSQIIDKALFISRDPMFLNVKGKNHQALGEYEKAEECFVESSYMAPNRVYPHYLLAKLYLEKGDTAQAIAKAHFVLDMEPKITSPATEEMKAEMKAIINR